MGSLFHLPDDIVPPDVQQSFPGREHQMRALATLVHPDAAPCRNIVLHGTEATGKSAVARALMPRIAAHPDTRGAIEYAFVNASQCITGRHLFERIVAAVAARLNSHDDVGRRCETLAQLAVALATMLGVPARDARWRFVLVLDAIDRQRDAPPTLLPALARMSEIIPCLICVFVVTAPPAGFLQTSASAHLHFPPYTKPEFVRILALTPPAPVAGTTQQETSDLWTRFCAAIHDALVRSASRTLPSFRRSCRALWPRFTAPVVAGTHAAKDFSKLLVAARIHFQDESLLNPSIVSVRPAAGVWQPSTCSAPPPSPAAAAPVAAELVGLLPVVARLLLLAAYLASHNATRHDLTLFSTHHHGRKRRRGGGFVAGAASSRGTARTKHRKIARKLLGAHAFVLERMLAIFEAVRGEWAPEGSSVGIAGLDGDVGMAMATLASLRLLVRVGSGDVTDRAGKWRINASWEVVRGIGRSLGVEVEEWLIE
ncbi:AAA ATPase domain-containing protein [Hirsutella rhossiliensis]|uniref:AAA ATPase domain-containing protein n=1 Tax=Hirsutella rhossiliensis TaxID=111463 RepID=A0A9P8N622_9HYPO|nr:AAA ATPase domain-containing protein [Hirsutella rhossiliensis]KAH0968308.1 AAA ATPase domain-containing protein [Hirsutella rhossiliensis]